MSSTSTPSRGSASTAPPASHGSGINSTGPGRASLSRCTRAERFSRATAAEPQRPGCALSAPADLVVRVELPPNAHRGLCRDTGALHQRPDVLLRLGEEGVEAV